MEISLEQKNEEIARMLGFIIKSYGSSTKELDDNKVWCDPKHGLPVGELKFDSDWNWLMKAVEFINSTHKQNIEFRDLNYTLNGLASGGYWNNAMYKEPVVSFNSIEDVFDAVYRYAKSWNISKESREKKKPNGVFRGSDKEGDVTYV